MGALEAEIIANNIEDEIRTNLSQRLEEEYSKIRDAVALITAIDLRLSIATLCHKLDLRLSLNLNTRRSKSKDFLTHS